jgi:probable rRNA maturation factor
MWDVSRSEDAEALPPTPWIDRLQQRMDRLAGLLGLSADTQVSILLTDDEEIRDLNRTWRDVDAATDVLSFAYADDPETHALMPWLLGDIAVSLPTALRQVDTGEHRRRLEEALPAWTQDWDLEREVLFLVVHGVLHLCGHDHGDPEEEEAMKAEEVRVMSALLAEHGDL